MSGWILPAWRSLALFLRLLFVCRVSLSSGVGGLLLFWQVVQAQDLLADISRSAIAAGIWHWSKLFFGLFVLWAFPVHYAARRALDDDGWIVRAALRERLPQDEVAYIARQVRCQHAFVLRWLPRVLGLLPFVAMLAGLAQVSVNLRTVGIDEADATRLLVLALQIACLASASLFVALVIVRQPLLARMKARYQRRRVLDGGRMLRDPFVAMTRFCLVATAALFLFAYFAPSIVSALMPRAALVPLLLGSLVLPLGFLGRLAHRQGIPYLFLLGLTCALLTGFNVHFNDLRSVPLEQERRPLERRQIDLAGAVDNWRRANRCDLVGTTCPPALIVAADGGASRAAFMTATVVGAILDQTAAAGLAGGPGRRIFAISGVSGGAVGAVMVRAALADAADDEQGMGGLPPCRRIHRTWYRSQEFAKGAPTSWSWRECLQVLGAGDFLSPTFVGLAFRDNLAPPTHLIVPALRIDDRAVLLEQAFERHYAYVTGPEVSDWRETGEPCAKVGSGLCRVFGYQAGMAGTSTAWLPLLALNGTSVNTGRRIVANDLRAGFRDKDLLYAQAYDLFEMRATPCEKPDASEDGRRCPAPQALDAPDIYLSTAALVSARFPVISPAGIVETGSHGLHGDAVVDGGYFENGGLTTAIDIARALAQQGVTPMILSIVNEPETERDRDETPPRPVTTPAVGTAAWHDVWKGLSVRVFGVLGAPIDTVLGTRGGHGAEARDRVRRRLPELWKEAAAEAGRRGLGTVESGAVHITIAMRDEVDAVQSIPADRCPVSEKRIGMPRLSMSWWLSAVVQADIDVQVLCTERNKQELATLLKALGLDPTIRR